jgi:hypothetical protein
MDRKVPCPIINVGNIFTTPYRINDKIVPTLETGTFYLLIRPLLPQSLLLVPDRIEHKIPPYLLDLQKKVSINHRIHRNQPTDNIVQQNKIIIKEKKIPGHSKKTTSASASLF